MKCEFSEQPYQWQDGEAWHVGRLVQTAPGMVITFTDGPMVAEFIDLDSESVLVRHLHTNELEFVEWGKLSPYPSSPIPEPTNTGRTY